MKVLSIMLGLGIIRFTPILTFPRQGGRDFGCAFILSILSVRSFFN